MTAHDLLRVVKGSLQAYAYTGAKSWDVYPALYLVEGRASSKIKRAARFEPAFRGDWEWLLSGGRRGVIVTQKR